MPTLILRIVLGLSGLAVATVGLNVGLGGILTLGWQVAPDFVSITDPAAFIAQDSHVRFLGGLFAAIGATLIAGALVLPKLWTVICVLCALMPIAGLFRLSGATESVFNAQLYTSLAFEFVLFPVLAFSVWRVYGRHE